jgi:hypothetical protein
MTGTGQRGIQSDLITAIVDDSVLAQTGQEDSTSQCDVVCEWRVVVGGRQNTEE